MPSLTERPSPENVQRGPEPAGADYEPSGDYCVRVSPTRKALFWGGAAVAMAILTGGGLQVFSLFQGGDLAVGLGMLIPVCVTAVLVCCVGLVIELLSPFGGVSWRVNDATLQILRGGRVTRDIPYGEILSSVRVDEKSGKHVLVTVIDGTWVEIGPLDARRARALDKAVNVRLAAGSRGIPVAIEDSPACEVTARRLVMWRGVQFLIAVGALCALAILRSWDWLFAGLCVAVPGAVMALAQVMAVVGLRYCVENGGILVFRRGKLLRQASVAEVTRIVGGFQGLLLFLAHDLVPLQLKGVLRNERAALCRAMVAQGYASAAAKRMAS